METASARQPLLRSQLLTWLLIPLFVLLTADALVSYWIALDAARRAYDRSLAEIARGISLHLRAADGSLALDMQPDARRVLISDPVDRIYFQVKSADGRVVAGDTIDGPRRESATTRAPETFYDGTMEGAPVRIVDLQVAADPVSGRPSASVRVAETEGKRKGLARQILLNVVVPQMLLILIAGVVVWAGVVRGLAPLERLQRAVGQRSHLDLSPVVVDRVPGEVSPLVTSINQLLARLESVLTLQSRFVSDAAHQLKTPIAALETQVEVALREKDPERVRQAVEELSPALERLSRLVSQLLSLARNEPDAAQALPMAPLDLNALALEVAAAWVPEALKRGVDLGLEGSARPAMIIGNAGRLRELLDNLLDNAIRYGRQGGGRVTVRVTVAPAPSVAVSDDGPGIPAQERERVFERFHRLLGSPGDGSGLGLAIAREIARIHGATITLEEPAGSTGSTFTVAFPPAEAGRA